MFINLKSFNMCEMYLETRPTQLLTVKHSTAVETNTIFHKINDIFLYIYIGTASQGFLFALTFMPLADISYSFQSEKR